MVTYDELITRDRMILVIFGADLVDQAAVGRTFSSEVHGCQAWVAWCSLCVTCIRESGYRSFQRISNNTSLDARCSQSPQKKKKRS